MRSAALQSETRAGLENRFAWLDVGARCQKDHPPLGLARSENENFGPESSDVPRRQIDHGNHQRSHQFVFFVVGNCALDHFRPRIPKSISTLREGFRARGNGSTATTRPTRISTFAKPWHEISGLIS